MRVVTWNVNGIRAAIRKGMDVWMAKIDADVWLLQEVRALPEQLPKDWELPSGHEVIWHPAEKKGYSGVASFSRVGMEEITRGIDTELDPDLTDRTNQRSAQDIKNLQTKRNKQ